MTSVDLDHPPEGVVILPKLGGDEGTLDPREWVQAVRRSNPTLLRQRAAEHLAQARELGEV